jgi:AcrR family transcriptional regulator
MEHAAEGSADSMPTTPHDAGTVGQRLPLDRVGMSQDPSGIRPKASLDRDRVLDATLACLTQHGYDGTTIRRIAAELGCAVGSIYRYFRDKRDLLVALAAREFSAVERAHLDGAPIDATIALYRRIADEHGPLYRLMFWLAACDPKTPGPAMPSAVSRVIDGWSDTLGDRDRAERMWAQLHGSIMLGRPLPGAGGQAPAGPRRMPALRVAESDPQAEGRPVVNADADAGLTHRVSA